VRCVVSIVPSSLAAIAPNSRAGARLPFRTLMTGDRQSIGWAADGKMLGIPGDCLGDRATAWAIGRRTGRLGDCLGDSAEFWATDWATGRRTLGNRPSFSK
jgi:hypothetical protein